jgi:hypothetical protein
MAPGGGNSYEVMSTGGHDTNLSSKVGRVALMSAGKYSGKVVAIVEIIDHKRVRLHHTRANWVDEKWPH